MPWDTYTSGPGNLHNLLYNINKGNKKVIKVMNFHKMSIVPTEASQTSLGEAEPMS